MLSREALPVCVKTKGGGRLVTAEGIDDFEGISGVDSRSYAHREFEAVKIRLTRRGEFEGVMLKWGTDRGPDVWALKKRVLKVTFQATFRCHT